MFAVVTFFTLDLEKKKQADRWWFQRFFWNLDHLPGEMIQFDERAYFSNGLVQPPTRKQLNKTPGLCACATDFRQGY